MPAANILQQAQRLSNALRHIYIRIKVIAVIKKLMVNPYF